LPGRIEGFQRERPPIPPPLLSAEHASIGDRVERAISARADAELELEHGAEAERTAPSLPRTVFWLAVTGVSLYLIAPSLLDVLGSWRELERIDLLWFPAMLALQVGAVACLWALQRMALHRARWPDVIESQLPGNALGKIVPAGGAAGAALQYRMLVASGLERGRTVAGITAVNLLTFAVVLALPVLALPAFLRGSVDRSLAEATVIGVAVFVLLSLAAVALLAFDGPLELVGRAIQSVRNRLRRGSPPLRRLPARLASERDRLLGTLGPHWKRAVLATIGRWAFDYAALLAALAAVGSTPRPALVLLAFCAAQVLAQVPVTPGGLGFVEAGLTAMLALAGVNAGEAVLATFAYRLFSYWLQLPAGLVGFILHKRRHPGAVAPRAPRECATRSKDAPLRGRPPGWGHERIEAVSDVQASLEEYRGVREALEKAVLPRATSVDGRRFSFQTTLHGLELEAGGYVTLGGGGSTQLGQLLSLELHGEDATGPGLPQVRIRVGRGEGLVLDGDGRPFHDAVVRTARSDEVGAWLDRSRPERAALDVGELALAPGVPLGLDAGGFGRHTFLCGQSGSGKTYALGVLLERLLMETSLRVVVLDPNSDYVRLGETREEADPSALERFAPVASSIVVRAGASGPGRIRVRFRELSPTQQAALLRLDPLADREEYAELAALVDDERIRSLADLEHVESDALKLRASNLGVNRWSIWPGPEGESIAAELEDAAGPRCLVVDLGSLATLEERAVTGSAVLEQLWRRRATREPIAIVIDEAHNVCPAEPGDPITALATEDAIRIAGEGRKFGLYLIVVTQRPQKVHENVLSQCDNLVLMRMNSLTDLAHVARVFSFVPPGLIDRATTFRQGEALVAGKITSHPALIRFGARITEEGGADVEGWA
jgi:uncharacterized protein